MLQSVFRFTAVIWGLALFELGLKVFISYLVGSLNGALLIGALYGGVDIRRHGSGNAGGTNALRTQGKLFAVLVMFVDIAKGFLVVLFLPAAVLFQIAADPAVSREWLAYACAGAVIFGHCYPVWFEFSGGKGFATVLGVLAAISPFVLLPVISVWVVVLLVAGYVGVATILSAFALPVFLAVQDWSGNLDLFLFSLGLAVFISFTHRSNIQELAAGKRPPDIGFSLLNRTS